MPPTKRPALLDELLDGQSKRALILITGASVCASTGMSETAGQWVAERIIALRAAGETDTMILARLNPSKPPNVGGQS